MTLFIRRFLNGRIEMMTTGEERRQFIHIDDVCRALHQALDSNLEGVYDISSFEWVSVLDDCSDHC